MSKFLVLYRSLSRPASKWQMPHLSKPRRGCKRGRHGPAASIDVLELMAIPGMEA